MQKQPKGLKDKIMLKINEITAAMQSLETQHLYWLTDEWKKLQAQREVLGEIVK